MSTEVHSAGSTGENENPAQRVNAGGADAVNHSRENTANPTPAANRTQARLPDLWPGIPPEVVERQQRRAMIANAMLRAEGQLVLLRLRNGDTVAGRVAQYVGGVMTLVDAVLETTGNPRPVRLPVDYINIYHKSMVAEVHDQSAVRRWMGASHAHA
jgi:hypothetical protein